MQTKTLTKAINTDKHHYDFQLLLALGKNKNETKMTEHEIILLIGKTTYNNLWLIISTISSLILGSAALSWLVSNTIHKTEIKAMQQNLNEQQQRFTQFESIIEQRIILLQNEAIALQLKIKPDIEIDLTLNKSIQLDEPWDVDDKLMLSRKVTDKEYLIKASSNKYKPENKISLLLERTDMINNIIKSLGEKY